MKYLFQILFFNLGFLSICLGLEGARADTSMVFVERINDSTSVEVRLSYTSNGEPEAYYCHVDTPVCEEGLCKLMVVDVYWDLLGNFLRYELPDGEALTKMDHEEFTEEDHVQLRKILSDRSSILRDYPVGDLVDRRIVKKSDNLDAVSSATRVDVKEAVVSGAVYSTYVLWHIVNGPIASRIVEHSKPFLTDGRVEKMFYSSNFYYQYYALNAISSEDAEKYLDEIMHLVKNGTSYIPYFAIEKLPASAWAKDPYQRMLLEFFRQTDFELQNFILNRIERVPLSAEALDQLVSALHGLRDSQTVKALAIVRNNMPSLSSSARERLTKLKGHSNKEIAQAVARILGNTKG